jgi:ATP-binding cassette subfamily B protein/ATP-binding cassette subfamily C protein
MLEKFNSLLNKSDRKKLLVLLLMSLLLSCIEVIGLAAIMPFITITSTPEIIYSNYYYNSVNTFFNFGSPKEFIVFFGVSLIIFYVFRAFYIIVYTYILNSFTYKKYKSLVDLIFKNYLNLPYRVFVNKNSSEMLKVIITEAGQLSALTINILTLVSETLVIIIIYILLLLIDVKMTIILTLLLGFKILLLSKTISHRIKSKSKQRAEIETKYYKIISESLSNFKLIKLFADQVSLIARFSKLSTNFANIHIYNNTIQVFPRIVLESFGFILLIAAIIYLVAVDNSHEIIPVISMYALALYRILPAMTKIMNSYNNILFHSKSLDIVCEAVSDTYENEQAHTLSFHNSINLNNVSFNYTENQNLINNINLTIKKGQSIAIIGKSGSGKSTLVDLLCGVLIPDRGKILIDNVELNNTNIISWRKRIGYIPQSIYLFDGTIAENISFGREYNEEKIIHVLKQANIYDTMKSKNGLNTMVGEGGIQLSGGQRQRIAIARALYGNPEILILDEATSSLDTDTEKAIMREIYKISEDKTLIVIAHRISTIEQCDVRIDVNELTV